MSVKAATVDTLIERAFFEPRVAVAVAQAIDEAIDVRLANANYVTVPVLEARLADLKGELLRHFYSATVTQFVALVGVTYFMAVHLK